MNRLVRGFGFEVEPTPKRKQFGLKSSNYLVINCHDLKVVAIQVADILGFSQILIFYNDFRSGLKVSGSRFQVRGSRFEVQGSRFEVSGSRFEV